MFHHLPSCLNEIEQGLMEEWLKIALDEVRKLYDYISRSCSEDWRRTNFILNQLSLNLASVPTILSNPCAYIYIYIDLDIWI